MSTIITRNSATSGSIPSSLTQGELAINVTDGKLFYGSGSGNVVKEFTASGSGGGTIDTGSFATTGSNIFIGDQTISGSIYLGSGSIISESDSTIIISPPGALPGQSLVLRPTATTLISNHPSGFYPGDSITITFTPTGIATTGTSSYTFTGCTEVQLGTPLTGSILFDNQISQSLTWTVPALSNITGFTFDIYNFDTFISNSISLSSSGSSENNHLHLISGNPTTTDLYLGDDDQYIKIEKNAGNVVIGTNLDTYQWVFDTNGSSTVPGNITFPSGSFISSTNISGNIYISALNDGTLHLNTDGGEGDVFVGYNGWGGKLKVRGDVEITGSLSQGYFNTALGHISHAEGRTTIAFGTGSHAEGEGTIAIGEASHTEGAGTLTGGSNGYLAISIVSGLVTLSGSYGNVSTDYPTGNYLYLNDLDYDGVYPINSFVINSATFNGTETEIQLIDVSATTTTAVVGNLNLGAYNWGGDQIYKGPYSHAEGVSTQAMGYYSHAEGEAVQAAGGGSHAEGYNTVAAGNYQHVQGQYNAISLSPSAFILGNGTADNARSNLIFASGSQVQITGSIIATSGFTGSLQGTASYATNALTASYAISASYEINYETSSSYADFAVSASHALTASFITASGVYGPYGSNSVISASHAVNGGVTQLLAGPNITVSPTTGVGQVTISSTGGGGGTGNTATGSYGSFYSTQTQTNVASTARSMSLNTTDITNGVSISGSTNPYNTYIKTENPGVYDIQFSAQVDKTDSGTDEIWIWLRKNGINVTDSATSIQLVGNGAHYVAAWNFFVNAAANDYFQLMWYSPDANVRLHAEAGFGVVPGIPSLIVTANRVDQFLSNTGSFSGSFTGEFTGSLLGTSSYATQALSSSYATTASYALNTSTPFRISTGSISASVNIGTDIFRITSGSSTFFNIDNQGSTTISSSASNIFLIKNQNNTPIFSVSQSGVIVIVTQSIELTGSAPNGGIYFTSGALYVGID